MHVNRFEGDTDDDGRVSPQRIRAYLDYDPATGKLTFREQRNKAMKVGARAGSMRSNRLFREIKIDGHRFREDRVVWAWITGRWPRPGYDVRHVNNNLSDSSQANLKEELVLRSRPRGKSNPSGYVGVYEVNGRFAARIRSGRADTTLGTFDTPEEASEVYLLAALERQIDRDMKARGLDKTGEICEQ